MNNKQILENFWRTMETNDFHAASQLLHDDYTLEWPQSAERIVGRYNFASVNTNYPAEGTWHFRMNHILAEGDVVVTDVSVTDGKVFGRPSPSRPSVMRRSGNKSNSGPNLLKLPPGELNGYKNEVNSSA